MKKKAMSAVLAAAMVTGMVVPTVSASAADKLVVYGIYKAGDQTWFIDEGDAAKKAVEDAGGEFIYVDAKMSPEEYLKAIDNAVANNASGIIRQQLIKQKRLGFQLLHVMMLCRMIQGRSWLHG